jgi:hypothetical protein
VIDPFPPSRARAARIDTSATAMNLRPATRVDLALLRRWDEQPHVVAADPNDDWK